MLYTHTAYAQQWETAFFINSQIGYSSNTYLNPYLSEWDRTVDSGYGAISAMGQTAWFDEKNVAEFTGGVVFEPLFDRTDTWKGGLGVIDYRRKLSDKLTGGIEGGVSYFTSSFERTLLWAQPTLSWTPSPFTRIQMKAGTNYRQYTDYAVDSATVNSTDQTGLYALEVTTWPSFNWQLSAGLYGSLETLPSIGEGFRSMGSVAYNFRSGERVRLAFGVEQYQNQYTTTVPDGGGPPVGGISQDTETFEQTSRVLRLQVEGSYPVSKRLSLFLNVEGLHYQSNTTLDNVQDIQLSGGVRFQIEPASLRGQAGIEPNWEKGTNQQQIQIRYTGEGQLYLVGDFNNWRRPGIPLVEQEDNQYTAQFNLEIGSYEYKILKVITGEEEWLSFSENIYTVEDGYGGENAMLLIEQ